MQKRDGRFSVRISQNGLIKSQKGCQVLWMENWSSFECAEKRKEGNVRYDLVFQAREEKNRDLGYGGEEDVGGPDLVAEEGEVAGWRDNAEEMLTLLCVVRC